MALYVFLSTKAGAGEPLKIRPQAVKAHFKTGGRGRRKKGWSANKRRAVQYTTQLVQELCDADTRAWYAACGKKDDVADAFLQLLYYLRTQLRLFPALPAFEGE